MTIDYVTEGSGYQPGVCNIGPEEMARRRRAGLTGLLMAAAIGLVLVVLDAPAWARVLVFPFLASGLISLEQVRRRFCVGFAIAGIRNLGPLGAPQRVEDAADRAADRRAALLMVAYMSAIAAAITAAFIVLPG